MKLEISLDQTAYGSMATEDDAAIGAEFMRDVARALGLRYCETWHGGTDDAHEVWGDDEYINADPDEDDYDDEWATEKVFELWCAGATVEDAAAKIRNRTSRA